MISPDEFRSHIEHTDDYLDRLLMTHSANVHELTHILRKAQNDGQPIEVLDIIVDEIIKITEKLIEIHDRPTLDPFTRQALGKLLQGVRVEMQIAKRHIKKVAKEQDQKLSNIIL